MVTMQLKIDMLYFKVHERYILWEFCVKSNDFLSGNCEIVKKIANFKIIKTLNWLPWKLSQNP